MKNSQASIVIPIFNESDSLDEIVEEIQTIIAPAIDQLELLFVNDSSTDNSSEKLKSLQDKFDSISIVENKINQGQGQSVLIGIQNAKYETIITMDGDLQVDPSEVLRLYQDFLESNVDFICSRRMRRADDFITKDLPSILGNKIISLIFRTSFKDIGSSLKVLKKSHLEHLEGFRNFHRYLTIILTKKGFTHKEVGVLDRRRRFGQSKYSVFKAFRVFSEIIFLKDYLKRL